MVEMGDGNNDGLKAAPAPPAPLSLLLMENDLGQLE